jgi:hypothetical protein
MIKKILIFLLLIIFASAGFVYFKYKTTPTSIYPYPYFVKLKTPDNISDIENSDVLILGSQIARSLDRFIPQITTELSKNLRTELKFYNWSHDEEGLHRSIAKLKLLKKLPPVVIIAGVGNEFLEERLLTRDKNIYEENFEIFKDDKLSSTIISFPVLSRFIYKKPFKYFFLQEEIKPFNKASSSRVAQLRAEYIYKFFKIQLEELSTIIREKGSTLVLISNPVNLEVAPRLICENSVTNTILIEQNDIEKLLKAGKSKDALSRLLPLASNSIGNARTHFQLGRAYLLEGNVKKAKEQFFLSSSFDCANWRVTPVFNKLLDAHAKKTDTTFLDFALFVESGLGRDVTFKDDIYPQDLYYQRFSKEIIQTIKNIFKI